jgi:hypothetical protein
MVTTAELVEGLPCRVYVGSDATTYAVQVWTERPDLIATVTHGSGPTPSTAVIGSWKNPAGGHLQTAVPGVKQTLRMPNGGDGAVFCPYGIKPHQFIKVVAYSDSESADRVIFLGRAWRWHWNHQANRIDVVAEDFRREMNRTKCRQAVWYRPRAGSEAVILDLGPVFNADGQADQHLYDEEDDDTYLRQAAFITPGYNRADDGTVADAADRHGSAHWRPGDALNYLRRIYVDNPLTGIDDYSTILGWSEAAPGGGTWEFLFTWGDGERRLGELDCCGRSLAWAVDQIVGTGPFDWTLEYTQTEAGKASATLAVYELYSSPGGESGDLALGEIGARPVDASVEVLDADWELDWTEAYARCRVVAARVRMDLTLDTVSGTLVPGWTAAQETAWKALDDGTPEELREKESAYPDVFCTWVAAEAIAWDAFFAFEEDASSGEYAEGARRVYADLVTRGLTEAAATGRRVPLRMIVQRYVGATWEDLPGDCQAWPLADGRVGFRLPTSVRWPARSHGGEAAETWSNDETDDYPMRVTLSVETDDRVRQLASDGDISWPVGELYIDAGPAYRFGALSSAYVRVDSGEFVVNGGTLTLVGNVTPYTAEDPYDEAATHAIRALDKVSRPRLRGTVTVPWIWPELRPGYVVGKLTGGGALGVRPDLDVYMAVREAVHDETAQVTRIRFEGV